MPFADDVRKYTFASLDKLVSKKGELITEHPYLPTEEQLDAMDKLVDSMDLMDAGDKDQNGYGSSLLARDFLTNYFSKRLPWFDTLQSYNPAIHRIKQAMFYCAVVDDIASHPLPPPHPELLKYFETPKKVLKRARDAVDECTSTFKIKEGDQVEHLRLRVFIEISMQCQRESLKLEKTAMFMLKTKMITYFSLIAKRRQKNLLYMLQKLYLRPTRQSMPMRKTAKLRMMMRIFC